MQSEAEKSIRWIDGKLIGHWEPGNGTSYKVIAVLWHHDGYMHVLGCVSDGWLDGWLTADYVQEKFVVNRPPHEEVARGISPSHGCLTGLADLLQKGGFSVDAHFHAILIAAMLGRERQGTEIER